MPGESSGSTRGRPGFALVLSILLVLAMGTVALGVLAVGTREQEVARALVRAVQAERRAEAAVTDAMARWSTASAAAVDVGGLRILTAAPGDTVTLERIDATSFRVKATARVPGPLGSTRGEAAVRVRALPLASIRAALPGAVAATGPVTVGAAVVTGNAPCGPPSPGIVAPTVGGAGLAGVTGTPAVLPQRPPPLSGPDPFAPGSAESLATVRYTRATAAPRPLADAVACYPAPGNWGSPDPSNPCFRHRPLVVAGDLVLTGGVGRGVLLVFGDLVVRGDTRFQGVVLVTGTLRVEGTAVLQGAVRAGTVELAAGTVTRDACALDAVLSAPALDGPFRDPSRLWVPAF